MGRYIFFLVVAFITLTQATGFRTLDMLFIACGVVAYIYNRQETNITSLLFVLILVRSVEIGFWLTLDMKNAYIGYPALIVLDSIALYMITKRNKFLAKWEFRKTGSVTPHKYVFTNADYILSLIYKCYLAITVLSLVEHFMRHLEDLGLPEEWSQPELLVVYNSYFFIKATLNMMEYVAILTTAHKIMQSERYVHA